MGAMQKREVKLEDGRYLIYYTFDEKPAPQASAGAGAPRPEPKAEPEAEDERSV